MKTKKAGGKIMSIHYDRKAEYSANRKTLASHAKNIEAEEKGGMRQKYFNSRFVQDNYHSMSFFKKVCKQIGNLSGKEIKEMLDILTKDVEHSYGEIYCFDEQKMYEVLISNPICKKVCEKQKYNNWQDIIARFN